jgi:hypothetical protein
MPRFGYYMPWFAVSGVFIVIGGSVLHLINDSTTVGHIYGYEILAAFGIGLSMQVGYSVAEAKFTRSDIPSIIRLINVAQIGGSTIGLSIAGTIYQNFSLRNLTRALSGMGYSPQVIASAVAGTQSTMFQFAPAEVKALVVTALIQALRTVWILVIVGGAVVLISSVVMKREKLFQTPLGAEGKILRVNSMPM